MKVVVAGFYYSYNPVVNALLVHSYFIKPLLFSKIHFLFEIKKLK
jgi:hypothetical protein